MGRLLYEAKGVERETATTNSMALDYHGSYNAET